MAKAKKTTAASQKLRKKKWFSIISPEVFRSRPIGETTAEEITQIKGRNVKQNLMTLTGDMKKQNINVTLKITDVKGETAYTSVEKYEMVPASIKRFVRRGKDRLDDSFVCTTADGIKVRIKPIIITGNITKGSVKTKINKIVKTEIIKKVTKMKYDAFITDVLSKRFQKEILQLLKKLTSIRLVEIRAFHIERRKKKLKKVKDYKVEEEVEEKGEAEIEMEVEAEEEKKEAEPEAVEKEEAPVEEEASEAQEQPAEQKKE